MFSNHSQTLHTILREALPAADFAAIVSAQPAPDRSLADVAIERGVLTREQVLARVARHLQWEWLPVVPDAVEAETLSLLTAAQARTYGVFPWRAEGRRVDLLAVDPFGERAVEDLAFTLRKDVRLVVADPDKIRRLIGRHYGADGTEQAADLRGAGKDAQAEAALAPQDIEAMARQAPIIRFVDLVLAQAVRDHASDVHFEPFEQEFKIRYRIDGVLHEMAPPARELALPITSRLKVLANLNIAERRVPQDGRLKLTIGGRDVDLRISTLPTQFGESVVLRVLDQANVRLDLPELGLPTEIRAELEKIIRRPNGIFIVTGPTGSGKTTTLYSGLRAINTPEHKLLTAEDPVEYEIEGIMQLPVNPGIGLSFATALRAFLRQDPDVIMVGEIRDLETAQVAVQASLTGHLVFSTLHTNDAAGTVTRLMDMGVEPFLIAATLEAVLAQRLVRRICPACRTAYTPSAGLLAQCGLNHAAVQARPFYRGTGCGRCDHTGYQGRRGIFEWLRMSDSIRALVMQQAATLDIRRQAVAEGMRTLREDGLRAVLAGETTVEEIGRYL